MFPFLDPSTEMLPVVRQVACLPNCVTYSPSMIGRDASEETEFKTKIYVAKFLTLVYITQEY
jgi:hypothetical protein